MKKYLLGLVVVAAFGISACGEKDIDKIGDAQDCINTSTKDTVSSCIEKIDGIETAAAYTLRCAVKFKEEGFDEPSRFINAFKAMDNASGSSSSTLAFMGVLAFSSSSDWTTNETNASQALAYCEKAGSPGYVTLAGAASIATTMAKIASLGTGGTLSQAQMEAAVTACAGNSSCTTAIGSAAITIYETSCSDGNTSNAQVCSDLEKSIAASGVDINDPNAAALIGAALQNTLQNP